MVTNIQFQGENVIITEDGTEYICDSNPGITSADMLIADFHPKNHSGRTILVQAFQDEKTLKLTYKPFSPEEEEKAWAIYEEVMDCM